MVDISRQLIKARGWVTGVNWYKYGAILAIALASHSVAYMAGKYNERVAAAERVTEAAEARTEYIIKEVQVRVPAIQQADAEAAALRNRVTQTGVELNDAVQAHPNDPNCGLSADELRHFNRLAEATK